MLTSIKDMHALIVHGFEKFSYSVNSLNNTAKIYYKRSSIAPVRNHS